VTLSPAILEILILRELQRSPSVTACFSGMPALSRKMPFLRKKSPPLSVDVMEAQRRLKLRPLHAALASVGEKGLAADFFSAAKLVFVTRKKRILLVAFLRKMVDVRGGTFARKNGHGGNGPQQELGEMAEGGGFLARNAPLREQAKNLGERAVHAGGGGEIAAGGMEFGQVECRSDDVTTRRWVAEQLVLSFGVKATEGGMNFGAPHAALASVGESELATVGQGLRRGLSLRFDFVNARKLLIAMTFARRNGGSLHIRRCRS
jgi:hypothetical protein